MRGANRGEDDGIFRDRIDNESHDNNAQDTQVHVERHPHDSPATAAQSKMQQQLQRPRSAKRALISSNETETPCTPHYAYPTANSSARKRASKLSGSSSASSRSSFHRFHVATTDPEQTTRLWKAVMSYRDATASSKGKSRATPSSSASKPTTSSPLTSRRRQPSTSITASLTAKSGKIITAKVTDADFVQSVLEPYGITMKIGGVSLELRAHFGILSLPTDLKERLDVYKKAFPISLKVWLEPDEERIRRIENEYKSLKVYGCNEAEYSTYALLDLFLDEARSPWLPTEKGDQGWMPVRLLQLVRKPNTELENHWGAPPELYEPKKRYEWDIRPDCAYHVSLLAFRAGIRLGIESFVSVVQRRAFCPYFTIEFKKDEENIATARNQVAVASAIALYNRYCLKKSTLETSGKSWDNEDQRQMRHYGLICAGVRWTLFCTVPKSFDSWTGCNMVKVHSSELDVFTGVQRLIGIVNDIHYWGLEVHGKSIKADIAAGAQSIPGADTNDITLLEE
ncbi:hypothetical protein GGR51DRAFT_544971 [Nemania sp. FL0031]|nr:hypothetical protein GGR51DRAFT_544971 [Nemania sp. FL0031]